MKQFLCLCIAAIYCLSPANAPAADSRTDFLKLLDRPRVPLAPQVDVTTSTNGITQHHFTYASDAEQRVPGILLKTEGSKGPRPVVISLHGTGGTKEGELPLLRSLAGKGFVAVAIDGRYHGERTKSGKGSGEYQDAILRAWRDPREHPFFYDTVWDVMRLVDYLKTREDVDASRIGLTGTSKGGIETYLTAAIDDRIAVAVPRIGVQSFHWALENNDWQGRIATIQTAFDSAAREAGVAAPGTDFVRQFYDRVIPGIYGEFDGPVMVPLIAPRPLLIINSDTDKNTPLPGVMECADAVRRAYAAAQAGDHFALRIQEHTGHAVTPESDRATVEWFEKWLKP
jgi:dienelactone hydrolase